jgi:hypothetical protein
MGYSAGDGSGQSLGFVCGHVVCFTLLRLEGNGCYNGEFHFIQMGELR